MWLFIPTVEQLGNLDFYLFPESDQAYYHTFTMHLIEHQFIRILEGIVVWNTGLYFPYSSSYYNFVE